MLQCEVECKAIDMKMITVIFTRMVFAPSLILKKRVFGPRKWAIVKLVL